jgi:hypothetical protein
MREIATRGLQKANDRQILDMLAFIGWAEDNKKSPVWISGQLLHDLNGIAYTEPGFLPRTSGYTEHWKKNFYDYENQAWVKNGVYVACNHPESMDCGCFGRNHAGEPYKY